MKRYGLVDINMGWITLGQLCGPLILLENSVRVVLDSLLCRGIESTSFVMIWMLPGLDRNSWVLAGVAGGFSGKVDDFPGAWKAWLVSVIGCRLSFDGFCAAGTICCRRGSGAVGVAGGWELVC